LVALPAPGASVSRTTEHESREPRWLRRREKGGPTHAWSSVPKGGNQPRRQTARLRRTALCLSASAIGMGSFAASAAAHSFLIRSVPEAGSRLSTAPRTMTLHFSEPLVAGSQQVKIRRANGHDVELPHARGAGLVIDQPLPAGLRGVFVVSWRIVSDDGHVSLGEFAFAAGSAAPLPKVAAGSQSTSWPDVAPSWLLFLGIALALGGLMSELVVWRTREQQPRTAAAPVVLGVLVALVGSVVELVLLAGSERGGGFASGLDTDAVANALGTRPGGLLAATLIALVVAGVLARIRVLRPTAVVPLLAGVVLTADQGHSGTSSTGWAVFAGSLHFAAVAVWVGALAHLAVIAARGEAPRPVFLDGVRRYSRLALPTVLLVLATGVLTAIPELRSLGDLFSTGYGRALMIKSGLVAVALILALTARLRALPANPHPQPALLRRLTMTEGTTVLVVLIAAAVLANAAPPRASVPAQAAAALLGPPPVAGRSLELADFAGQLILSVTAGARELQFNVVAPGYQALGTIQLTAEARQPDGSSSDLFPRSCGGGCFSVDFPLRSGITRLTARVSSSKWSGGQVRFTIPWPLGPQRAAVIRRISNTMDALRSITFTEQLELPYGKPGPPTTHAETGRQFAQTDLEGQPLDVRAIGTRNGLTEYAFTYPFPGAPIWYRIWVNRRYRLRRELIVAEQGRIYRTFQ